MQAGTQLQLPAASTLQRLSTRRFIKEQSQLVGPDVACDDEAVRSQLAQEPLWHVLLVLSASAAAVQQLSDLHACALEEARIIAELNSMRDKLCALHVEISEKRTFDCLLITNLRELRDEVQKEMQRLDELRKSRCVNMISSQKVQFLL